MRHLLLLTFALLGCTKKETPAEPAKQPPVVVEVAKPEPVQPASPVVFFAWWSRTRAGELLVPKSKDAPLVKPQALTRAFCERSGALKVAFVALQNGNPQKAETGMPLDIEVVADDLPGARFKVVEGTVADDERICLVTDEAFAKSVRLLPLEDADGNCTPEQAKRVKGLLTAQKTCHRQRESAELSAVELGAESQAFEVLLTSSSKVQVDLGDPNGEFGAAAVDLALAFKTTDGKYLVVTCEMAHESVTTSLSVIGKTALEEVTSTLYYNAAGG